MIQHESDNKESARETLRVILPKGSVMLPAWVLLVLCGAFVLSAVGLLCTVESIRNLNGEIRVLQINTGDIENVLIRQGIATRADFAPRALQEKGK